MLTLGNNLWLPENPPALIAPEALKNTWLIGQTGKSTLLHSLAVQLAHHGYGFCFIDPLSSSVSTLLDQLPSSRIADTLYLNPLSEDIIPWNPLEDLTLQQDRVASQMVSLLETMLESGSFLYRSQDLLKMAVLALQGIQDATLLHIPKLLTDDEWRRYSIAPKLGGPVRDFWDDEYEQWIRERERSQAIAPLLNKMRIFTTSNPLRDILCAKERISPRDIMRGKILLCDLQANDLGQLETTVLSSLLLARLSTLAKRPYTVFIDNAEFLSAGILESALANPHLRIILAHTHGRQVDFQTVMAYTKNLFVFQVNDDDAKRLETLFPENVQRRHLVDQRPYTCYTKLGQQVFRLETLPPLDFIYADVKHDILEQSRRRYARPRQAVRDYLRHVAA